MASSSLVSRETKELKIPLTPHIHRTIELLSRDAACAHIGFEPMRYYARKHGIASQLAKIGIQAYTAQLPRGQETLKEALNAVHNGFTLSARSTRENLPTPNAKVYLETYTFPLSFMPYFRAIKHNEDVSPKALLPPLAYVPGTSIIAETAAYLIDLGIETAVRSDSAVADCINKAIARSQSIGRHPSAQQTPPDNIHHLFN